MLDYIFFGIGIIFLIIMGIAVYISSHVVHEQKKGKTIPLFWEKELHNRLLEQEAEKFRKALKEDDNYS
ncbi:MAG: hypothetical protein ACPGCO_08270 [Flavobacteriaceae bacterium]